VNDEVPWKFIFLKRGKGENVVLMSILVYFAAHII